MPFFKRGCSIIIRSTQPTRDDVLKWTLMEGNEETPKQKTPSSAKAKFGDIKLHEAIFALYNNKPKPQKDVPASQG